MALDYETVEHHVHQFVGKVVERVIEEGRDANISTSISELVKLISGNNCSEGDLATADGGDMQECELFGETARPKKVRRIDCEPESSYEDEDRRDVFNSGENESSPPRLSMTRTKGQSSRIAKKTNHKKRDGASLAIGTKDKLHCINLILRLCCKASLDPMWLLRRQMRSLSKVSELEVDALDQLDDRIPLERLINLCRKKSQSPGNTIFEILPCIALVIEYRRSVRRQKEDKKKQESAELVKALVRQFADQGAATSEGVLQQEEMIGSGHWASEEESADSIIDRCNARYYLRVGDHALALCWAISPRNLFGLNVLSAMSLTRADIHNMSKAARGAMIMLFTGHWDPLSDPTIDTPSPIRAAVMGIVRTILPAAEIMLIMNLKREKEAMNSLRLAIEFDCTRSEEHFGFKFSGFNVFMPKSYLVSHDFASRDSDEEVASLLKSTVVLKHPSPITAYTVAEATSDCLSNLVAMQRSFFHWPIDTALQTPSLSDAMVYPAPTTLPDILKGQEVTYELVYQHLLPSLQVAFALSRKEKALYFTHDRSDYAALSHEYLESYKDADADSDYTRTVDVEQWIKEEFDSIPT